MGIIKDITDKYGKNSRVINRVANPEMVQTEAVTEKKDSGEYVVPTYEAETIEELPYDNTVYDQLGQTISQGTFDSNPDRRQSFVDFYRKNYAPPKEYDEQKAKRNRMVANIADTLLLLSDIAGASSEGIVNKRKGGLTPTTEAKNEADKERQEKAMILYNQELQKALDDTKKDFDKNYDTALKEYNDLQRERAKQGFETLKFNTAEKNKAKWKQNDNELALAKFKKKMEMEDKKLKAFKSKRFGGGSGGGKGKTKYVKFYRNGKEPLIVPKDDLPQLRDVMSRAFGNEKSFTYDGVNQTGNRLIEKAARNALGNKGSMNEISAEDWIQLALNQIDDNEGNEFIQNSVVPYIEKYTGYNLLPNSGTSIIDLNSEFE